MVAHEKGSQLDIKIKTAFDDQVITSLIYFFLRIFNPQNHFISASHFLFDYLKGSEF